MILFFKQRTAYELRISDWSSDVCSSDLNDENNIIQVLADLGQPLGAFDQVYSRDISVTPGRSFAGKTKDYGFSGQIDYDFGGATLTSIKIGSASCRERVCQ